MILVKDKELSFSISPKGITHELIIGDNRQVLPLLINDYRGKVDFIYIDPPYGKQGSGKYAKTNYANNITREDLLAMLQQSLHTAKELLSDMGVIFCSIDDNNYAYIKILFDEIFEEKNYIGTFFWKKTENPPNVSQKILRTFEHILCYEKKVTKRKYICEVGSIVDSPLLNSDDRHVKLTFPANSLNCKIPDGIYPKDDKYAIEVFDYISIKNGKNENPVGAAGRFKWTQSYLDNELERGTTLLIKSEKFSPRYQKHGEFNKTPKDIIDSTVNVSTTQGSRKDMLDIGFKDIFSYTKPVSLIKYLIKIAFWKEKDITVLDFFAGSGTVGQAVMEMNSEDGGKRKFILVNTNEITSTTPNGIVYDVTAKRLKRVMTGKCYDGTSNFKYNKILGGNLRVLKIEE